MASVNKFSVICKSAKGKINVFTDATLTKCKEILDIRKANKLKFADVVCPTIVTDFHCYHLRCYRSFTALMSKYRESTTSTSQPSPCTSMDITPETSESVSEPLSESTIGESVAQPSALTVDSSSTKQGSIVEQSTEDETSIESMEVGEETSQNIICLFCNKNRKMYKSREQALYSLGESAIEIIKSKAIDAEDISMLQTIREFQCQNAMMFYHSICKVDGKYEFTWFEGVQLPQFVSDILLESNEEENEDHERTQSKEIEEESDDDTDNTELTDDENESSSEIESLITDYA